MRGLPLRVLSGGAGGDIRGGGGGRKEESNQEKIEVIISEVVGERGGGSGGDAAERAWTWMKEEREMTGERVKGGENSNIKHGDWIS